MLKVQIWKGAQLIEERTLPSEAAANVFVDQCLTSIHAGHKGEGTFRVNADHYDDGGTLWTGVYVAYDEIVPVARPTET